MWRNLNFIHSNIYITIGISIQLYEISLTNYQDNLATILEELTAYVLARIFTTIIQLGKNHQPSYLCYFL